MPLAEPPSRETSRASPYTPSAVNKLQPASPYTSIDSENGDIRLLELSPGNFDDPIAMRLILGNLSDAHLTYDALSYVWGTTVAPRKAMLNDIPITITSNLDCALRHLRGAIVRRILWVDAVSILQRNITERNHQVRMMGKIYSSAREVVVWLGPVDRNDLTLRAVLGAMQLQFANAASLAAMLFDYMVSIVNLMHEQAQKSVNAEDLIADAIQSILSRPWVFRLWVVQELALARRAMIRIGTFSFPWEPFESFIQWIPGHKADVTFRPELANAARMTVKMNRSRPFSDQLLRTLHLEASDPRDKIFGILGISSFNGPAIIPDYTHSMQQVVHEIVCLLIKEKHFVLYYCMPLQPQIQQQRKDFARQTDCPSWIPDLRIEGASFQERISRASASRYHGEADHRPQTMLSELHGSSTEGLSERWFEDMLSLVPICPARILEDGRKLVAPGVLVGIIAETFPNLVRRGEDESPTEAPQGIYQLYHHLQKTAREISEEDFVHALTMPRAEIGFLKPGSDKYRKSAAVRLFAPAEKRANELSHGRLEQAMQELVSELKDNICDRICFLTTDDSIGITHHPDANNGIRQGDLIVGLFGINFPFILRLVDESSYTMINVAGLNTHRWGHSFFNNSQEHIPWAYPPPARHVHKPDASWKDYEEYGLREWVIV